VIRVVIVDDHAIVCAGLRLLLEAADDISVEDEAGSAEEAVWMARLHKPDVVLLDIALPGRSGLEAAPEIRKAAPHAKLLVLSMHDDASFVREAFAVGVSGYLLKDAADEELIAAVREVAAGRRYLCVALGARIATAPAEIEARTVNDSLSEREHEVLRLLALGYQNQEIAQVLYLSVRTVEAHRQHIMRKLGVSDRAGIVRYALAQRLLLQDETAA
jgi:DNA-binding NarL/FixJ family response regulator